MDRPRLRERLSRGEHAALTLVSAPAGFGKTTLLAEWLDGVANTAWLTLDERDNDPAVFWSYVVAALRTVHPDIGEVDSDITALINDLGATPGDVVLALDDYHAVESPDIHEGMTFLLAHLPAQVHLVVGTRADPPFPLATLRARGELVEVRATDLRFTAAEAAAYLGDSMGLDLSDDDVGTLEAQTEGWIAALQLAALSLQGRDDVAGFIDSFAGDDRYIVDYLAGEVLQRQPDDVRDFLLRTSVLHRLTGSICDAVTGQEGGRDRLESLDRANLFVVALDDRREWYRYHHLFADVLRARLLDERPDLIPELHRRASGWHADHGDPPEAIRHALAAQDFAHAADLVEVAMPAFFDARQEATARAWLDALPDDVFVPRPVLTAGLVGARMSMGHFDGVVPLLDRIEASFDQPPDDLVVLDEQELGRLPTRVAMYRAALALVAGDISETVTQATRALEQVDPDDLLGRGGPAALLGLAHWNLGDLDAAHDHYADAVDIFRQSDRLADVLGCSLALADIQMAQGRLRAATRTLDAGLGLGRRHGLRGTADMHVALSQVRIERDDLDGAREHLRASDELGDLGGLPQNAYRSLVAKARVSQAEGDLDGALALLDQAAQVHDTDFSPDVRPIPAMKARLRLAQGDVDAALRWVRHRGLSPDDDLTYLQEYEHVTLARVLLADGARDEATRLLDRLLTEAEAGGRTASAIEILVLQGRLDEARERGAPEGYVRVVREAGARPERRPQGLVDELSGRELDVLRLLRSDLTGPEIARELTVSLNTLRTHTKNIFTKLGVNNRRQAVSRADDLGL